MLAAKIQKKQFNYSPFVIIFYFLENDDEMAKYTGGVHFLTILLQF